jgi:hypothetical protein
MPSPNRRPSCQEGTGDLARKTYVFQRGNWLVKGKEVKPDVPKSLPPMAKELPKNRLGLAKWMVSREHPLTARVAVNRFWEQLFGTGIVETVEDVGTQGIQPTHRELLDWLAARFHGNRSLERQEITEENRGFGHVSSTFRSFSRFAGERSVQQIAGAWSPRPAGSRAGS